MIWVFAVDSFSSLNIKLRCPRTQSFQLYVKSDCSTTRVQSSSLMGVMSNCCQLIPMAPGMNHSQKCQLLLTSEGHIPFLWGIIWSKLHSKSLWSFASFYLLQWVNHRRVLEFHNPSQNELQSPLIHYFQKNHNWIIFSHYRKEIKNLTFFLGLGERSQVSRKVHRLWDQKGLRWNSGSKLEKSCNFAHELKLSTVCFLLTQMKSISVSWKELELVSLQSAWHIANA